MYKSYITQYGRTKLNFVKRFGNIVSMKGAFALKEHMTLTHFYHWNNFAFGEGSSLHLDWNIIKSTRLEQNLFNPRKWKLVINVPSAVWSFLSLAPMISKPLWPQWSFPIGQDVPFQSGAAGGTEPAMVADVWGRGQKLPSAGQIQPTASFSFQTTS